jgi:hypothetical protein
MTEDLYAQERENLIEGDPIVVVDELLALRAEVKELRAKVKSGVEAAHDIQKQHHEWVRPADLSWYDRDPEGDTLSILDDACIDILTAMEEPEYYQTLQKETIDLD